MLLTLLVLILVAWLKLEIHPFILDFSRLMGVQVLKILLYNLNFFGVFGNVSLFGYDFDSLNPLLPSLV